MLRPVVSININSRRIVERALNRSGVTTEALSNRIGQEMVAEVEAIVRRDLPSTENSKKNQTALENSLTYKVERGTGRGGYPWRVSLTIKPGVSKGKIAALNWGVTPRPADYTIYPRNVPRALKFKNPDPRFVKTRGKYAGQALASSARRTMTSGPRQRHLFLEEARMRVMRRHSISEG